jgi:hypothetical protein
MNKFPAFLVALTLFFSALAPVVVLASEITVRPFLIDETLEPRDVSVTNITIKSDYPVRKAILYATVNEITLDAAGEIREFVSPVMTDRTNTVTSWIEISRARIEVPAGETKEVPLTIRVHPKAEPGEYHVFIGIVEAPNRPKAETIALAGEAKGVLVKIVISDQREDSMHISSFTVDRFVTGDDSREINIEVENKGDIASAPEGEIVFYDARGIEVDSLPVAGNLIAPGETGVLTARVPVTGELGRFKANVTLNYGGSQKASLFDTTYFYLLPTNLLALLFGGILIVSILLTLLFRRAFFKYEDDDDYQEVTMYVRDGHDPNPQDHDIDLKNN